MPEGERAVTVEVLDAIGAVPAAEWDACAGDDNPFVGHAFLSALEDSGSVGRDSGWLPRHMALKDGDGRLIGAVPLYLKGHSFGEYVFDHAWADAYERAGGQYYPKLLSAVPFTPVTGPRLLVRPGADRADTQATLTAAMLRLAEKLGVSSLHVNFPLEDEWQSLGEHGLMQRMGQQYHWENRGYGSFDDFLAALSSRKRKAIRKERREVVEAGVRLHALTGDALRAEHWDAFYRFYRSTTDRKWGWDYLSRPFFDLLHERLRDRVVLILAERDGDWVAGALNLLGRETLYGRNWGCTARFRFLHFEACYYQAIDFAIANGLKRVEAGAQGQHKLQRGYLPVATYSAHWIADPGFRRAVADFLRRERQAVGEDIEVMMDYSPFRKGGG